MNIELPAIPAGIIVLLGLLSPYAIALANDPTWTKGTKKVVSIVVSLLLSVVVILGYYLLTGDTPLGWPWMILLLILVSQTSYSLITKRSATEVEKHYGVL